MTKKVHKRLVISIQTMVNVMFYLSDPVKNSLFSFVYLKTLFFVLLGVSVYWLLFRNFLTFEYVGNTMFNDSEKVEKKRINCTIFSITFVFAVF